ncbi:MAG: RecQ family ATP-dependent DNA helicase [Mesonia hippocampi]|uniref:RecQ family ATP-dependent DNA helicase n=1 Tax=Mesonia hippocampi TaxID=1628250 RepID=UPI003F964843
MHENLIHILQKYWGYTSFRPSQKAVIETLYHKNKVIGLLPTGAGKSICFQVPAIAEPGICLVVSPLIALMQDQQESLKKRGIKTINLSGNISHAELNQQLDNCLYGNYKLLYISPERLQNSIVQERLASLPVSIIAIDEAHCISEWGTDFRPAYKKLAQLTEVFPKAKLIALTATATPKVVADIKTSLAIPEAPVVKASFARPNIFFSVFKTENKHEILRKFLLKNTGVSIIYVRSRKNTHDLSDFLNNIGLPTTYYHAGIAAKQKQQNMNQWLTEAKPYIVATSAFGMGIDKSNVRNVVHFDIPESIESYYQEAGRAGRDQHPAKALLLYNKADFKRLEYQFIEVLPTPKSVAYIYKKLNAHLGIAYGEGITEDYQFNLISFCKRYNIPYTNAFLSLKLLERYSVIQLEQSQQLPLLKIEISAKTLEIYLQNKQNAKQIIEALLRIKSGYFDMLTSFNPEQVSKKAGVSKKECIKQLQQLHEQEIIQLYLKDKDTQLKFLVPREDKLTINPLNTSIKKEYQHKVNQIQSMVDYINNSTTCKVKLLLSYFGESIKKDCQYCSVCHEKNSKKNRLNASSLKESIINFIGNTEKYSHEITAHINVPEKDTLTMLRILTEKNIIKQTIQNSYILTKNIDHEKP